MTHESADRNLKRINEVDGVVGPLGHYSQIIELSNGLVLFSGQKAWDPQTGKLIDSDDVGMQTEYVLRSISRLLARVDLAWSDVVRMQCYLARPEDYEGFNAVYERTLGSARPTRSVIVGVKLRGGALVEIVPEAFRDAP